MKSDEVWTSLSFSASMPWDGLWFSLWRNGAGLRHTLSLPENHFSVLCSLKKLSSRYISLLALSTGPKASTTAQEIIQTANGIQMHANSCAHTHKLGCNYHTNYLLMLVTIWTITQPWLPQTLVNITQYEACLSGSLGNWRKLKSTLSNCHVLLHYGRWASKVAVRIERAWWKLTLRSPQEKEKPSTNTI